MADEILLSGKKYVSSKHAASSTGYAQDYIGQLSRAGVIDAQRVGGLWYVLLDSLEAYKRNAEGFTPQPPVPLKGTNELETIISFDGKDYVSSSRAAKLTGYNPDYVGQLARAGKVLSRQIGKRWYIEREGLLAHKKEKDALLAGVQAEAAGLVRPEPVVFAPKPEEDRRPQLTYVREEARLFPELSRPQPAPAATPTPVPIRVVQPAAPRIDIRRSMPTPYAPVHRAPRKGMARAAKAVAALTVVIVLSYGFTSLSSGSTYAILQGVRMPEISTDSMSASATSALESVLTALERLVSKNLHYVRS